LGNDKPKALLDIEKVIWVNLFIISEGIQGVDQVLSNILSQVPWESFPALLEADRSWFNLGREAFTNSGDNAGVQPQYRTVSTGTGMMDHEVLDLNVENEADDQNSVAHRHSSQPADKGHGFGEDSMETTDTPDPAPESAHQTLPQEPRRSSRLNPLQPQMTTNGPNMGQIESRISTASVAANSLGGPSIPPSVNSGPRSNPRKHPQKRPQSKASPDEQMAPQTAKVRNTGSSYHLLSGGQDPSSAIDVDHLMNMGADVEFFVGSSYRHRGKEVHRRQLLLLYLLKLIQPFRPSDRVVRNLVDK
jgi:hypothetical protein